MAPEEVHSQNLSERLGVELIRGPAGDEFLEERHASSLEKWVPDGDGVQNLQPLRVCARLFCSRRKMAGSRYVCRRSTSLPSSHHHSLSRPAGTTLTSPLRTIARCRRPSSLSMSSAVGLRSEEH